MPSRCPWPMCATNIPCARPSILVPLPSGLGFPHRLRIQNFFQTRRNTRSWDRSVVRAQAGSGSGTTVGSTPGFCPGRFSASFGFWPSPGLGPGRGRAEFATPSPSRLPSGNPSSPVGLYSQPTCDAIHHTIPRAHSFRDPIVHPAFMSMLQTALT